jgi:hypothetical protein
VAMLGGAALAVVESCEQRVGAAHGHHLLVV